MIIHLQTTITQETLQSTTIKNVQTHDLDVATLNSSYVTQIIVITLSFYTLYCGELGPFGDVEFDELPLELVSLGDVSAILHFLTCNHDALNHGALTCNYDAQRKWLQKCQNPKLDTLSLQQINKTCCFFYLQSQLTQLKVHKSSGKHL